MLLGLQKPLHWGRNFEQERGKNDDEMVASTLSEEIIRMLRCVYQHGLTAIFVRLELENTGELSDEIVVPSTKSLFPVA